MEAYLVRAPIYYQLSYCNLTTLQTHSLRKKLNYLPVAKSGEVNSRLSIFCQKKSILYFNS